MPIKIISRFILHSQNILDVTMASFTVTEKEFEESASEWFRQAKQRHLRQEKKNLTITQI